MKTVDKNIHWLGVLVCTLTACADPCLDDGLVQQSCNDPGGAYDTGPSGADDAAADDSGGLETETASGGGDGESSGDGESGDSVEETTWCQDLDGDGFGDPDHCIPSSEPVDGSVDNDDDCDDGSADVFPGAAPNDDPLACMRDADGDDWGDATPPAGIEAGTDCLDDNFFAFPGAAEIEHPSRCMEDADDDGWGDIAPPAGAEAGTDCLDDNPFAFPGAAELEKPPGQCTLDADEDGWGEALPGEGLVVAGSDCYDGNADLNPTTMRLTAFVKAGEGYGSSKLVTVDPTTAALSPLLTLSNPAGDPTEIEVTSATLDSTGQVIANESNSVSLRTVDPGGDVCMGESGQLTPIGGNAYGVSGDVLCGLEYGAGGLLHGVDHDDNLMTFNPATGLVVHSTPVVTLGIPLNIDMCDMAYDCAGDRLLVANGINKSIYVIDPMTGVALVERNLSGFIEGPWHDVGLEYDQVEHQAYLSIGLELYSVDLDSAAEPAFIGTFTSMVHNLQNLPICD